LTGKGLCPIFRGSRSLENRVRQPLTFVVITLLASAAIAADAPVDVRLTALPGAEAHPLPAAVPDGPGAALAVAAGVETFPVACATPVLMFAEQAPPGSPLRQLLLDTAPVPDATDDRALLTRDGRFVVHVPAPAVGRASAAGPEYVARVVEALVASRAYLAGTLGFPDPVPGPDRLPVILTALGHGLEGYVAPARPGTKGGPAIVLDATLPADRIMAAVLHQMAHLSLPPASLTGIGWGESVASYLTLAGTGDIEAERDALRAWLEEPARGFDDDRLLRMQGGLVWPLFLAERTGDPDVVRQIAAEIARGESDPETAADLVLKRGWGFSREAALREMAIWNLRTGGRADRQHYAAAPSMPEAALVGLDPALPLSLDPVEPVAPGGSVAFRLPSDGGRGSLVVSIRADGGRPGADLLAFYAGDDRPALVPVDLASGSGSAALPWGEAREAWIVLRNGAGGTGGATRFDVDLSRDPRAPFDLASFTVTPQPRSVALEWVTASESGLVGWNVLRSESPDGPFARLNGVAVPAWGDGGADTGYVFLDDGARPGRRYYYLLEGLTAAGLVQRSHVASARVPGH
jgi:hypothetical protein